VGNSMSSRVPNLGLRLESAPWPACATDLHLGRARYRSHTGTADRSR
jgi:hypothetical protein